MPEETDVIKPYDGPPATPDNFTRAFPEYERLASDGATGRAGTVATAPVRGRMPLDSQSERNLADLRRQVRNHPYPAATVINLHPWPLQSADMFLRGIVIPACEPGMDFAHHHIRSWSHDKKYSEDGNSFIFSAIRPIDKAAQFLIKFADPEVYGGGVLIYEGDRHPHKQQEVELYSGDGRPMVTQRDGFEEDDEQNRLPVVIDDPIRGNLQKMIEKARQARNEFYLSRVRWADEKFKSNDVKDRRLVTPQHRMMADVLVAEGILPVAPDWNMATALEQGLSPNNCKACGNPVSAKAYKCTTCGNIVNAYEAFMDKAIEWGHAKLDDLEPELWAQAEVEHKRREEVKAQRSKGPKKAGKTD